MSLMGRLAGWLAPFRRSTAPDVRRAADQRREADRLLRQLRAELRLMQLWRDAAGARQREVR